jgi:Ca-activated chloride channel homolog
MNITPDDPKWTAYVLGELSEAERAEIEQELGSSALAREVVEEIRLATSMLKQEFAKEQTVALAADQRRAIQAKAASTRVLPIFRWAAVAGSVAAGLFIVASLSVPSLLRSRQAAVENTAALVPPSADKEGTIGTEADRDVKQQAAVFNRQKLKAEIQQAQSREQLIQQAQQGQQGQQAPPPAATPTSIPVDLIQRQEAARFAMKSFGADEKAVSGVPAAPAALADRLDQRQFNTESYDYISDNPFIRVAQDPLATFSIDVDTASYANIRRFLTNNQTPPKDSVRIEEMINYFTYDYPSPTGRHPVAAYAEVASAPWQPDHRLVRIGIKAKEIDSDKRPPSNLVFLIDVSGSMATPEKLPMLKNAMKLMVEKLGEGDHVAIVTYAGASGVHLRSTSGDRKDVINAAIDNLNSGGSTNGGAGIVLAYDTATSNFIRGGTNRVILATDGDFNVGVTNQGDLIRLIEDKAKSRVFLSVLGFGMGNYKDSTLEKLADKGNGNYAYIDTMNEARKVLVEEMNGTLLTVAKDVKIQVEFNPAAVNAYRLIGYENRALRHEDFNDDRKDAGDMGAGQSVTALFEVVPRGIEIEAASVDRLRYQQLEKSARRDASGEMLNVRIRYKQPDSDTSQSVETPVVDRGTAYNNAGSDFRFAAAVASFGMILRESPYKGESTLDAVIDMAERSRGADRNGYRDEFIQLVRKARLLRGNQ